MSITLDDFDLAEEYVIDDDIVQQALRTCAAWTDISPCKLQCQTGEVFDVPLCTLMCSETYRKHSEFKYPEPFLASTYREDGDDKRAKVFKECLALEFPKPAVQNVSELLSATRPTLFYHSFEDIMATVELWKFMLLPEIYLQKIIIVWFDITKRSQLTEKSVQELYTIMEEFSGDDKKTLDYYLSCNIVFGLSVDIIRLLSADTLVCLGCRQYGRLKYDGRIDLENNLADFYYNILKPGVDKCHWVGVMTTYMENLISITPMDWEDIKQMLRLMKSNEDKDVYQELLPVIGSWAMKVDEQVATFSSMYGWIRWKVDLCWSQTGGPCAHFNSIALPVCSRVKFWVNFRIMIRHTPVCEMTWVTSSNIGNLLVSICIIDSGHNNLILNKQPMTPTPTEPRTMQVSHPLERKGDRQTLVLAIRLWSAIDVA